MKKKKPEPAKSTKRPAAKTVIRDPAENSIDHWRRQRVAQGPLTKPKDRKS